MTMTNSKKLRKFNNKGVKVTDISDQTFQGICLYEDKEIFEEKYDGLSIKTGSHWTKIFENEILKVQITDTH